MLTNEGVNGLVSQLISDGYGNYNLYDALVVIQANTNPSVAGIITPAFLAALQNLPPSSAIFTTALKNVNPGTRKWAAWEEPRDLVQSKRESIHNRSESPGRSA